MKQEHKILVLEDEAPLLHAIESSLVREGYNVIVCKTVNDGFKILNEHNITLIWLDHYLLGNETGLDFVVQVKKDPKFKKIPIFVVSNTASDDKIKSYINHGVTKYYVKSNEGIKDIINEIPKYISR